MMDERYIWIDAVKIGVYLWIICVLHSAVSFDDICDFNMMLLVFLNSKIGLFVLFYNVDVKI